MDDKNEIVVVGSDGEEIAVIGGVLADQVTSQAVEQYINDALVAAMMKGQSPLERMATIVRHGHGRLSNQDIVQILHDVKDLEAMLVNLRKSNDWLRAERAELSDRRRSSDSFFGKGKRDGEV
jgi:hypothetical protein